MGSGPESFLTVDSVLAQNIVLSLPNDTEAKKSKKCTRTMLTGMGKIASFTRFCSSFPLDPTGAKNRTFRFWGLRARPSRSEWKRLQLPTPRRGGPIGPESQ